jgi:tRNA (adenine-N(1)-)-methyltransferase non-catalytic subunit
MSTSVRAGDSVVLALDEKSYVFVQNVQVATRVFLRKKKCFTGKELLGQRYGGLFELVEGNRLKPLAERKDVTELLAKAKGHGEDNRSLKMESDAQQLSQEQIEQMKQSGQSADAIIEALMMNSATLETKTAFSQEKWLKKKMAKYSTVFQVSVPFGCVRCFNLCFVRWGGGLGGRGGLA